MELDARTVSPGKSQTYTSWTQPTFGEKALISKPSLACAAKKKNSTANTAPASSPLQAGTGMNHASYTPKSNSI